ncbi:MAG: glycosyltransferase, exosortase A system-associated [Gammaproteobacteria bacterium]|nr:glycosyltransferase, exosortase A system-associated [Gammaproteobacteria bacterium]
MHILHVLDHSIPLHSGYTFRTKAIIEQQHALGWTTDHITSTKHNLSSKPVEHEETVDGLRFHRTLPIRNFISAFPLINQYNVVQALERRLLDIIPIIKPTVIHAHSPALNGLAAIRAGARFGIPVVYEIRAFWEDAAVDHGTSKAWGLRYRLTRALETYVIKKADAVTTICDGLRNDIVARGVPQEKVTVIPNAVNIQHFQYGTETDQNLVTRLGLDAKSVIGFIGSFYAYEGLHLLLEALPIILSRLPNCKVLLVGGGSQESYLKKIVAENNMQQHVIFTGRVPHDEVQKYYNLIDILIYPRTSIRLTELVTPLKPLEAMAQGRLLLASNIGGHRELIENNITGVLFQPDDPQSLASAVLNMMENKGKWGAIRTNAKRFVDEERSWYKSVSRYMPVYEKLTIRK